MKKIILISLLLHSSIQHCSQDDSQYRENSYQPKILTNTVKGYLFRIIGVAALFGYRTQITNTIREHPCTTLLLMAATAKFISDSYSKHNHIKEDFTILELLEELYDCFYMHQK